MNVVNLLKKNNGTDGKETVNCITWLWECLFAFIFLISLLISILLCVNRTLECQIRLVINRSSCLENRRKKYICIYFRIL